MKAELSEDGVLIISPETPIEAFAIKQWARINWVAQEDLASNENGHFRGSSMVVIENIKER